MGSAHSLSRDRPLSLSPQRADVRCAQSQTTLSAQQIPPAHRCHSPPCPVLWHMSRIPQFFLLLLCEALPQYSGRVLVDFCEALPCDPTRTWVFKSSAEKLVVASRTKVDLVLFESEQLHQEHGIMS